MSQDGLGDNRQKRGLAGPPLSPRKQDLVANIRVRSLLGARLRPGPYLPGAAEDEGEEKVVAVATARWETKPARLRLAASLTVDQPSLPAPLNGHLDDMDELRSLNGTGVSSQALTPPHPAPTPPHPAPSPTHTAVEVVVVRTRQSSPLPGPDQTAFPAVRTTQSSPLPGPDQTAFPAVRTRQPSPLPDPHQGHLDPRTRYPSASPCFTLVHPPFRLVEGLCPACCHIR